MTTQIVKRDGKRDLCFEGTLLAEVSDRSSSGPRSSRWREVRIYKTYYTPQQYVVAVTRGTLWEGEEETHGAVICQTPEAVADALTDEGYMGLAEKQCLSLAAEVDYELKSVEFENL